MTQIVDHKGEKCKGFTHDFEIYIKQRCWEKMFGWCRAANSEVSGLGLVSLKNGKLTVKEVFLLKQTCTAAHTELDKGAIGELQYRLKKRNIPQTELRFWWHTHYNFQAFWSGTDDENARTMFGPKAEWGLSMVINQSGEYRCRLDVMHPFGFTMDDLTVFAHNPNSMGSIRRSKKEVKKKVKPALETGHIGHTNGHHGHDNGYGHGGCGNYGYGGHDQLSRSKIWETHYWNGFVWIPYNHIKNNKSKDNRQSHDIIDEREFQDDINDDSPAPDGVEEYKNEKGYTMVWVSYLHCYIKEGDEWADTYTYGKNTLTRMELRDLMIAAEKNQQLKTSKSGGHNGKK